MTVIVGIGNSDYNVLMGCDRLASTPSFGWIDNTKKVFSPIDRKDILLGLCGNFRLMNILENTPKLFSDNIINQQNLILNFIPKLMEIINKNNINMNGTQIMLGNYGKIYVIQDDMAVLVPEQNFAAIGCGEEVATGVLSALLNHSDIPDDNIIEIAIHTTGYYNPLVSKEYYVMEIGL